MKEPVFMICLRAVKEPEIQSVVKKCYKCSHDVWVTAESVKQAERYSAHYLCEVCSLEAVKRSPDVVMGPMSPGQIKEAKERFQN